VALVVILIVVIVISAMRPVMALLASAATELVFCFAGSWVGLAWSIME
jgi:hypothetical protein